MKIGGKEIVLTASIGIVVDDGMQSAAQDFLREGEIAMLRAKRAGADRIEIFTASMRGEDENRLPLESDLRKALEKRQLAVLYQPITRLASNQLAGFEALIRWDHPTHGQLGPEEFVPIAEEAGFIGELGSYVLGQALEEASRWHKILPRERDPLFVSVNVSSRQLFRQDLVQEIRLMLAKEQVPKGTLKLEISESLVMENPERAVEILTWLKTFGASLALDDFGTGYCSLSYLHRFPCDTIKVDKSLVRDSGLNGSTPLILRSIIALSHELGKEVVAEGVETAEDAAYLRSIGCEYAQGFYYGEPMAAKEVEDLLSALATHRKRQQRERSRAASRGHAAPAPAPRPVVQAMPPGRSRQPQACPESLTRRQGSMPILPRARLYLRSTSGSKISSGSAVQCSQPLAWISLSSWPGAHPAERKQRLVRAAALGDIAQDVDGGGEAHAFVDWQRALGLEIVGAVQHEAASGLDRAAEMHRHGAEPDWQPDALLRRHDVELLEQLREADIRRALIDDDAHGAVGGVGAHIDHGAGKTRVAHARHGDEQAPVEIAVTLTLRWFGTRHPIRLQARSASCEGAMVE